jgi:hypothetical protein
MKTKWILTSLAACMAIGAAAQSAEGWTTYNTKPGKGNLIFIEGTSTMHDWRVQGTVIGGKFMAGPGFPTDPAAAKLGKVEAKTENVFIPVRALKSVKADGTPYSESMDGIMYEKLRMEQHRNINFALNDLTLKEIPQGADGAFVFDAKGTLQVGGETKDIVMPVRMKVEGKALTFSGEIAAKMTDFKIEPVSALAGTIKTGDDIKLGMSWVVQTR